MIKFNLFDWIRVYIDHHSSDGQLLSHLKYMNESGQFWLVCCRGYSQRGKISRRQKVASFGLDFICLSLVSYIVYLAYIETESVQIMTSVFILINFLGIRWASIYCELTNQFTILRVLDDLLFAGHFDGLIDLMGPVNCRLFKKFTFIMVKFNSFAVFAAAPGLVLYNIFAVLRLEVIQQLFQSDRVEIDRLSDLWWSIENRYNLLIVVPGLVITIIFLLQNVAWCFTHIIIFMTYSTLILDNIINSADHHHSSSVDCSKYWRATNYCYNQINIMKQQFSPITFYGFMLGCFGTDFALFTGCIYGTGNSTLNLIIAGLGLLAVSMLTMINITAAQAIRKINYCEKLNYRLSYSCKCSISIKLKRLSTIRRMQISPIGFYVGNLFLMDNYRYFVVSN
ncbi:uncharacterized protein LOC128389659 [Panonychus citri]|uniref:uncharacterized protein LOC128389659 n=1 Tax=Panonychus citri TaxID=50023 RepID=UPI00230705A7|nr:uncharacterized protein LOC128389659 [Panonychus citri]